MDEELSRTENELSRAFSDYINTLRYNSAARRLSGLPCSKQYSELYRLSPDDRKGILDLFKVGNDVLDLDTLLYSSLEVQKSLVEDPHVQKEYKFPIDFWVRRAQMALGWEMNMPVGTLVAGNVGVEWSYHGNRSDLTISITNGLVRPLNPSTVIRLNFERGRFEGSVHGFYVDATSVGGNFPRLQGRQKTVEYLDGLIEIVRE